MKKTIVLLAVLLGVAGVVNAEPAGKPDAKGWTKLFTGDLSDATFPKGVWSVKDGVLSATEDQGIFTKKQYENFTLDLEFKTSHESNSGVIVYCSDMSDWIPNSVEIQLFDDHAVDWTKQSKMSQCGAIYGHLAPKKSTVKKPGEWNHMTIVCKGKNIKVTLNGELITDIDLSKWTSATKNPDGSPIPPWLNKPYADLVTKGCIGLQGKHGGDGTVFRNVKIKQN
jgi:hypothetical protein